MFRKNRWISILVIAVSITAFAFGLSKLKESWKMVVNGQNVSIPVHVMQNGYFVALNDLAKLPGWKVTVDLSSREVDVNTPGKIEAAKSETPVKEKPAAVKPTARLQGAPKVAAEIKTSQPSGPPSDVGMTVQAAVAALSDLKTAIDSNANFDLIKSKRDGTSQTMQQAQNLLWTLPRTRTLQADLQVGFEDLDSQVTLLSASGQTQNGILPWTHPTAQNLLLKYPDLRPCHVTKDKTDGLDVDCARKIMSASTGDDFSDIERDLAQYR